MPDRGAVGQPAHCQEALTRLFRDGQPVCIAGMPAPVFLPQFSTCSYKKKQNMMSRLKDKGGINEVHWRIPTLN